MSSSEDPFRKSRPQSGPIGQWVGERYRVDEFIGKGAFGQVFKAWDAKLDRVVALKVLTATTDRARQRFLREIKTTARLQHPHIVATHDSGLVGTNPYLVMTYLDGTTLETLASGGRVVEPLHAATWIRDASLAIQLAHEMGIIHRDVKPGNIIIDKKGKAFVLDFGVASLRETADAQRLTQDGSSVGTPAYMSPEQLYGQQANERSDVYSLGATLYQALTATLPLTSLETGQVPVPSEVLEGIPPALDGICMRCLSRDPNLRYPTAVALAEDLQAFVDGDAKPAQGSSRVVVAALGGAVLVALLGGLGLALASRGSPPPPPPTPVTIEEAPDQVALDASLGNARGLAAQEAPFELVEESLAKAVAACKGDAALLDTVELARLELEPPYALRSAQDLIAKLAPLEEVVAKLASAAKGQATRAEARLALLRLLVSRWRPAEATPLARELALAEGPPGLEARLLLARALRQQGETEACLRTLESLAADDAEGAIGACARAARCSLLGEFIGANEDAAAAVELDRELVPALLEQGLALVELGETARAADVLGRVIALRPDSVDAHLGLARLLGTKAKDADLKRAQEKVETALALTAGPPPGALRLQGSLLLQSGEFAQAKQTLTAALKSDRRDVRAYILRGFVHDNLGDSSAATRDWKQGRLIDVLLFTRFARERSASQRSRLEAALEFTLPPPGLPYPQAEAAPEVARVIASRSELIPANAREEIATALRLASQGADWTQLELHLQRAARAAPTSAAVALERVRLLVGRDRDSLALEAIEQARKLGADAREVDRWEAEAYLRRNDTQAARKAYGALVKADPQGVQGLCAGAELGWQRGNPKEALACAERALKLDPDHAPSLLVQGVALIYLGRGKDALKPLDRALELEGAINARVLLMRAVARAESVLRLPNARREDRLDALLEFERLRRITRGVAARVIGAKYALRMPGTLQWAQSVLWEARAFRPQLAQTYVLLGLHGIKSSAPRAEVIAFWRMARDRDAKLEIGKPLRTAFQDAYGDVDLDDLLLRSDAVR